MKGTGEKRLKHLNGDSIETMVIDKSDEVIKEVFESVYSRYLINADLESLIKYLKLSRTK